MATALFRLLGSEQKSTAALAINQTNTTIASKIIAGASYLGVVDASEIGGIAVDYSGNIFVADKAQHVILRISEGGTVKVVAGLAGTSGINGTTTVTAAAARFNAPTGIAVAPNGDVYVADSGNNQIRVIRGGKVGVVAGDGAGVSGFVTGTGGSAKFSNPVDVAVDKSGNIYVADKGNHSIRKIVNGGKVIKLAGTASGDGSNCLVTTAALFTSPEGVEVDNSGNVWVLDSGNDKIKKITPRGFVYYMSGSTDGKAKGTTSYTSQFKSLRGISIDSSGNIYVVDRNASSGSRVLRLDTEGKVFVVADMAGSSSYDDGIVGISVSPSGKLFIATDAT